MAITAELQRHLGRLTFVSRRAARAGIGGEHRSRQRAASTEFVEYRPYQPGDDFRRVDWNVYGRLGSLQVKLTEARERLDLLLVLDCSNSMDFGQPNKLRFGADLITALAYVGAVRAEGVRVSYLGQPASASRLRGRSRLAQVQAELARIVPAGMLDLDTALPESTRSARPDTLCIVVSDLLSRDGIAGALDRPGALGADIAVLHVVAPQELAPEVTGEVELVDAESGSIAELGVSAATLDAYRARFSAWLAARESECRSRGLRYARLRTDTPLSTVMLNDLRQVGLLR